MNDPEQFFHFRRMNRLAFTLKAPLGKWVNEVLRRVRRSFGEPAARAVRRQLDEAFVELVTRVDPNIVN
jgi:hypothetical protein